eukprot:m51a1_g4064 hypothetical protein (315) ;mRNA; f:743573-744623
MASYLSMWRSGKLSERAARAHEMARHCCLCARRCGVDRESGAQGFCRTGSTLAFLDGAQPHYGEESCLVGSHGSGTIFFSSCNLRCCFCQNHQIAHGMQGDEGTAEELAGMMLSLQDELRCHNINLVTPTHQLPQILSALCVAAERGLRKPLVWNCGGYESLEALELLDGVVDIYMPDFKFWSSANSAKYLAGAADYPDVARACIREMHRQVGDLQWDDHGVATRGLLVRHLVMPGNLAGTKELVQWLAREVSPTTYINVMGQYRPCFKAKDIEEISRPITDTEFDTAVTWARDAGLRVDVDWDTLYSPLAQSH